MYFLLIGLFVALTPGILFRLPNKGSKVAVAATHALVFAVVVYLLRKYQYEGFQNAPPVTPMPPMPPIGERPPMPSTPGPMARPPKMPPPGPIPPPGAGPESITLTKEDLQQIKNSMSRNVIEKLMQAMQIMAKM